jgi:hypothetical protein
MKGNLRSDCYLVVHISFLCLSLTLIFLSDLHSCIVWCIYSIAKTFLSRPSYHYHCPNLVNTWKESRSALGRLNFKFKLLNEESWYVVCVGLSKSLQVVIWMAGPWFLAEVDFSLRNHVYTSSYPLSAGSYFCNGSSSTEVQNVWNFICFFLVYVSWCLVAGQHVAASTKI